jgi:hypothetical protein
MPLFKTGHQPKTHMPSTFRIEKEDRKPYELSVGDPNITEDERELRREITTWARKQVPGDEAWMYVWFAAVSE